MSTIAVTISFERTKSVSQRLWIAVSALLGSFVCARAAALLPVDLRAEAQVNPTAIESLPAAAELGAARHRCRRPREGAIRLPDSGGFIPANPGGKARRPLGHRKGRLRPHHRDPLRGQAARFRHAVLLDGASLGRKRCTLRTGALPRISVRGCCPPIGKPAGSPPSRMEPSPTCACPCFAAPSGWMPRRLRLSPMSPAWASTN